MSDSRIPVFQYLHYIYLKYNGVTIPLLTTKIMLLLYLHEVYLIIKIVNTQCIDEAKVSLKLRCYITYCNV